MTMFSKEKQLNAALFQLQNAINCTESIMLGYFESHELRLEYDCESSETVIHRRHFLHLELLQPTPFHQSEHLQILLHKCNFHLRLQLFLFFYDLFNFLHLINARSTLLIVGIDAIDASTSRTTSSILSLELATL